jgi:hypothetical protein
MRADAERVATILRHDSGEMASMMTLCNLLRQLQASMRQQRVIARQLRQSINALRLRMGKPGKQATR